MKSAIGRAHYGADILYAGTRSVLRGTRVEHEERSDIGIYQQKVSHIRKNTVPM